MLKDAVAVIDIGAYSLHAIIGENGVNNNFIIRAYSERRYEGFDGETIDEANISAGIRDAIRDISVSNKARIDKIYVGIPGEFLMLKNTNHRMFFNRKKRLKPKHITEFFDSAQKELTFNDYEVISRNFVCAFSDGNVQIDNPVGTVTSSLSAYLSFTAVKKRFLNMVRSSLTPFGIKEIVFIPTPLATARLLFSKADRNAMSILLDVGYVTSSLTIVMGNGALFHTSYSFGGGYITAYLMKNMNTGDMGLAEKLKRKINLSIATDYNGDYNIEYGDNLFRFSVSKANDIVRDVLDDFAEQIDEDLRNCAVRIPANMVISLTGGGISYVRGAKEHLANRIEMPFVVVKPENSYMSKPENSSELAVLNYALNVDIY